MTSIAELHRILSPKKHVWFDLDDTLHEFRRASGAATTAVLNIVSTRYGVHVSVLQAAYSKILREKTSSAFADGKSSRDYRRERFTSLLDALTPLFVATTSQSVGRGARDSQQDGESFMKRLLELYESTLMASLTLKPGARELLQTLKGLGKRIVVVTEGPQDAQERTLRGLGLEALVDRLATTNAFGVSKVDGMLGRVLTEEGLQADEVVYVGDSLERDVVPGRREGMVVVHYMEGLEGGVALGTEGEVRVYSLAVLQKLFLGEPGERLED